MRIPFEPRHVAMMSNHGGQEALAFSAKNEELIELSRRGHCYTFIHHDKVIGCSGITGVNKYRAGAWALFQKLDPKLFIICHRHCQWMLESTPYRHIEAYVDLRFDPALRWIRLLNFKLARAYVPYYFPDGAPASEWVYTPWHS